MAQRRMLSLKVVDTDAFLDMPLSTQNLYFHFVIRADDDGFIANPKKIMRMLGNNDDDYKVLISKKFVIPFQSGVCVIKHWLIHNLIRSDRYKRTQWVKEKGTLHIDKQTKKYSLMDKPNVIPIDNQMEPQVRLGKDRLGKDSSKKGFRPPTPDEVSSYCKERKNKVDPDRFIDFYSAKGWFIGQNKMKDWRAAVRTWEQKNKQPRKNFKRPALIVASELKSSQYSKDEIQAEMLGKYTEQEVGQALERLF